MHKLILQYLMFLSAPQQHNTTNKTKKKHKEMTRINTIILFALCCLSVMVFTVVTGLQTATISVEHDIEFGMEGGNSVVRTSGSVMRMGDNMWAGFRFNLSHIKPTSVSKAILNLTPVNTIPTEQREITIRKLYRNYWSYEYAELPEEDCSACGVSIEYNRAPSLVLTVTNITEIDVTSLFEGDDLVRTQFTIVITSSSSEYVASNTATLTISYDRSCGVNDRLCDDHGMGVVCYNPNHATCADVPALQGWPVKISKLCAPGDYGCYVGLRTPTCYSREIYTCTQDWGEYYRLCPRGTFNCGETCYDPSKYTCCYGSGKICQIGQSCCF